MFEDVGDAQMIVRSDDLIRQAHFADQIHGPRFGGQKAVGTGFEHAALLDGGLDHAAQLRGFFDQRGANAGLVEVVSGGKSGDSSADDQNLWHRAAVCATT